MTSVIEILGSDEECESDLELTTRSTTQAPSDLMQFELGFGKFRGKKMCEMIRSPSRRQYLNYLLKWPDLRESTAEAIRFAMQHYRGISAEERKLAYSDECDSDFEEDPPEDRLPTFHCIEDDKVPFGKYKTKTWGEMIKSKPRRDYLKWLLSKPNTTTDVRYCALVASNYYKNYKTSRGQKRKGSRSKRIPKPPKLRREASHC